MGIDEAHIEAILDLSCLLIEQGQLKKAKDIIDGVLFISSDNEKALQLSNKYYKSNELFAVIQSTPLSF